MRQISKDLDQIINNYKKGRISKAALFFQLEQISYRVAQLELVSFSDPSKNGRIGKT